MEEDTFSRRVQDGRCPFYPHHARLVSRRHDRWSLFAYWWCRNCELMFNIWPAPHTDIVRGIEVTGDVGNKWLRTCVVDDAESFTPLACIRRVRQHLA